ncbi:diguanylate cyclase domain-containing protein [Krasilnikovia sp. MM14-A1259]|uniref:GGDEF domain-containing protein n=1 Tax=Krasilnikovia sp. MM14-A1259 TaxID=3373539 RepID=UPI0037F8DEEF
MHADANAAAPRSREETRAAIVRTSSIRAILGPAVVTVYLAATPYGQQRPLMIAVVAVMISVAATTWRTAARIARSPARVAIQAAGLLVSLTGSATLSLLDGGIASPLGALVPISVMFYAIMMPPRAFVIVASAAALEYWAVALLGGPAPAGYAAVYTLGLGGVSTLCLRHAAALAALRRRLSEVSRVDPLTGSLNRRGFDQELEHAVAEARRTGQPVTLILTDLDRFKHINDTWGHQAGDAVLAATAHTMKGALRDTDQVGRLGGDEFGALLTGTGPEDAPAIVARMRGALESGVPASLGYASCPAEAGTVEELRRLADARAYADKTARTGRAPAEHHVRQAGEKGAAPGLTRVSSMERRRRSIADMGWLCVSDCAVGVVYAAAFGQHQPHRLLVAVWCTLGMVYGVWFVRAAGRLSRARRARLLMTLNGVFMLALTFVVPLSTGGIASATGLGMLAPMPLIALGTHVRLALPLIALNTAGYFVLAAALGSTGVWYPVMHAIGFIAVAAACAAQGRDSARRRRRLTDLSQTDALTGVLNRRGFEAHVSRLLRPGQASGLVLFDLDGFKALNDTAGHSAGDDLLRWVAATLREQAPSGAVAGRLGGDEFVVLFPGADVRAHAERLRTALAQRTAASIGTAVFDDDGADFASLYAHADAEMYAEKAAHRRSAPPRRVAAPRLSAQSA